MPKKMDNELAKTFESYRELVRRRSQLEELLKRAEAEKDSVKPDIYERVCREYQSTLDEVTRDINPLETTIDESRRGWVSELDDIEIRLGGIEEKIEEAKFRHRVGEYSETEYAGFETPLKKELDDLFSTRDELKNLLAEIDVLRKESRAGENGGGLHPDDGDGYRPDETVDAGKYDDPAQPDAQPAWPPPGEADVKAADPAVARNPGDDSDDLVDLTEWTREFREENGERRRRAEAPTEQPAVATEHGNPSEPLPESATQRQQDTEEAPAGFPILIITKGPGAGKKLPLVPMTMTLGREHDNNIELKDEDVARYHARISYRSGHYFLEDLESSSGTWLNDEKITEATLRHGDKLRVGATEMIVDFE
jgi:hypothetical protein